jgi:hypothetical protein
LTLLPNVVVPTILTVKRPLGRRGSITVPLLGLEAVDELPKASVAVAV